MSKILNLGVLAHVDAGKTSLTERILFEAGAIHALGSVDTGTTHTDTMPLEQQRGITIRAAVASLAYNHCHINLIDTPGHPDFIAEVERSLSVLDAVVLVVSSVEGVQPQTRRLARAIKSLNLPCVIFCNKIDRTGAREESLLTELETKLGWSILPLGTPRDIGTREATSQLFDLCDERLVETLAGFDDDLLETWLERVEEFTPAIAQAAIRRITVSGALVPVLFGSAVTGTGIADLLDLLTHIAPEAPEEAGPLSAQIFNVTRDKRGERIVSMRIFDGELCSRHHYPLTRDGLSEPLDGGKITRLERCVPGGAEIAQVAGPGDIVRVHGLTEARIGDVIGQRRDYTRLFNPVFETVVRERDASQRHALRLALTDLADQDPFIALRSDPRAGTTSVRLFGDVQKEVIEDALLREYGIAVDFEESSVICIERPIGEGNALEHMGATGNPFAAGVGLHVRSGPPGSGVRYWRSQKSLGKLPHAMYVGIEETVYQALGEGLYGWEVTDIVIELTFVEYADPVTVVGDFRALTPLVLMSALKQAGTEVCEPLQEFRLEVPEDRLAEAVRYLVQGRAVISESGIEGDVAIITGQVPAVSVPVFERLLPGISRGEGDFDYWHFGWQRVPNDSPSRQRTDFNPLDRTDYLSRLSGRIKV